MANNLFYYFGDDEAYFRTLQGEFRHSSRLIIKFKKFFETEETKIQSLFIKIFKERPDCVFIDFSKYTQDYLHLARLISRTPLEHKMVTVGLLDYLSPQEVLLESIATGVHLSHIKSSEVFDVTYGVSQLISEQTDSTHGFAVATPDEKTEAGVLAKIGLVRENGLHFESDYNLAPGTVIKLNNFWSEKKIIPSKSLTLTKTSSSNQFYPFQYNSDADFLFVDEFIPPEGMSAEEAKLKSDEREELILHHKKLLKKWLESHQIESLEKKAKVLVIDRNFPFYQDQLRSDKHHYTIRCLPFFIEMGEEIERISPQVVAYSLDAADMANPKNTLTDVAKLITLLQSKFKESNPFVIVFNCQTSSKELQEQMKYSHCMAYPKELTVGVMEKMADAFDKKLTALTSSQKASDHQLKVYVKKNNVISIVEIMTSVHILKLSETDLIFSADFPLRPGTNIHLSHPVDMFVNVRPSKSQGKTPEFYGLIHGLGEVQKKELRRYVNSIFFRDHDGQVAQETEEFKKLNELKLQEKLNALVKIKADEEAPPSSEEEKSKDPPKN